MEKLVIEGGYPLEGEVPISGSKNAALPIMAATLLAADNCRLDNVPRLRDVVTMCSLIEELGAQLKYTNGTVEVDTSELTQNEAPYDLVKKMRASVLVLGPLVARLGEARVSLPGGCAIGTRPINLHLEGLEALGAEIKLQEGTIYACASGLEGAEITLDFPSVGATENILMAASLASGETVIENAAREPEIADLARAINKMGGRVEGAGTDRILVEGVEKLHSLTHSILPDRIETGTYLTAGAISVGKVKTVKTDPGLLHSVLKKLKQSGMEVEVGENWIDLKANFPPRPVDIVTMPYPGFPTDMQAQFTAMLARSSGTSTVKETIFEDRFMHVLELERLGADIKIDGNWVTIHGVEKLEGAPVMATDLRASAALVLAGLAAEGETEVRRIYHLDRGYEKLEEKLKNLGAKLERQEAEGP